MSSQGRNDVHERMGPSPWVLAGRAELLEQLLGSRAHGMAQARTHPAAARRLKSELN